MEQMWPKYTEHQPAPSAPPLRNFSSAISSELTLLDSYAFSYKVKKITKAKVKNKQLPKTNKQRHEKKTNNETKRCKILRFSAEFISLLPITYTFTFLAIFSSISNIAFTLVTSILVLTGSSVLTRIVVAFIYIYGEKGKVEISIKVIYHFIPKLH